jgi:hypothetical protein
VNRRLRSWILRKDLGLAPATTHLLLTQIARGWVNWRFLVSLPPPPSRAFRQMSSGRRRVDPLPPGVLTSALSALQGRFAPVTTPVGGTASGRGESFVSSLLGGGYVDPGGGLSGRGLLGDGSAGDGTILGSRASAGGSTAYEVMDEYRDQVISPVTAEEVFFSTPVGTRGGAAPGQEFWFSPFARTPTQDTPSGPSNRPKESSGLQMALLLLGRQLGGPAGPGLATALPSGASQGTAAGARTRFGGNRKVPQGPEDPNIGAGTKAKKGAGDLKLYRHDLQDRHLICGGIISKRGGRGESVLRCHQLRFHTRQEGVR